MIKPTVGRVVLYMPRKFEMASVHNQPFRADICHVHNDECVNLSINAENGKQFIRDSVTLAQDREPHPGECYWMDYQRKQVEKSVLDSGVVGTFGFALAHLKLGARATRAGWNGAGMFVYLVPGSEFIVNRPPLLGIYPEGTPIKYRPHLDIRTADGSVATWAPSMSDALAEDWLILGPILEPKAS